MRQDIRDRLAAEFDSHRIERRLHDVPPHEVYAVVVDGRRAVYKGDTGPTGNAEVEGRVTRFVDEHTAVPVPGVLAVGDGYYVAAWHPDAPAPDASGEADEAWARAAGRALATLHGETDPLVDEYGPFRSRNDALAVDGFEDWHAAAIDYVRQHEPVLAEHGHADVAAAVTDFLTDHPDCFRGAGGPVCCHGWATPEHVSVRDGEVACVVDFEHAVAAPGEFDYWRSALPTFENEAGRRAFREGYESVRELSDGFERRRPLYVVLNDVYYFESLYVQDQHGPAETEARAAWFREDVFDRLDDLS